MLEKEKRLFFGWEVQAPWPEKLPSGRHLKEHHRHLTLAFLGNTDYRKLLKDLPSFPKPSFSVAQTGYFDQCLFLPEREPHVIAWHIKWFYGSELLQAYYESVISWLREKQFSVNTKHGFMPHVTLARSPFNAKAWRKQFTLLPLFVKNIHLYESVGHLCYEPVWSLPIQPSFEEIEHTADMGFIIRGEDYNQLYWHGVCALAFHFPPLLRFIHAPIDIDSLENVVQELNQVIRLTDQEIGSPYKAVSYHHRIERIEKCFHWEMIIDV